MRIICIRDMPALIDNAAEWFADKWGIPIREYSESMHESMTEASHIPQWYIVLHKNKIIAGAGVIENDFHSRKDLTPNLCALYVEEEFRKKGVARRILDFARKDMANFGFSDIYLITDHANFYEKCGWKFLTTAYDDEGRKVRVYQAYAKP